MPLAALLLYAAATQGQQLRHVRSLKVENETEYIGLDPGGDTEMLKAGDNQAAYQLAASLYQKSLLTLRIAVGK